MHLVECFRGRSCFRANIEEIIQEFIAPRIESVFTVVGFSLSRVINLYTAPIGGRSRNHLIYRSEYNNIYTCVNNYLEIDHGQELPSLSEAYRRRRGIVFDEEEEQEPRNQVPPPPPPQADVVIIEPPAQQQQQQQQQVEVVEVQAPPADQPIPEAGRNVVEVVPLQAPPAEEAIPEGDRDDVEMDVQEPGPAPNLPGEEPPHRNVQQDLQNIVEGVRRILEAHFQCVICMDTLVDVSNYLNL